MIELTIKTLLAYLLGTVMGGAVVGKLKGGVNLRAVGSGNVGATNALRTQGPAFAALVLLIDAGKGVAACTLIPGLAWPWGGAAQIGREGLGYVCGLAVALGHVYPVWSRFRGGKGVATLAGVFGALLPWSLLWMLPAFMLVILLSGYVSLGSVSAAIMALFYVACVDARGVLSGAGAFTTAMVLLVLFKHRLNLSRLWRGKEHRFEKARVLGRWLER